MNQKNIVRGVNRLCKERGYIAKAKSVDDLIVVDNITCYMTTADIICKTAFPDFNFQYINRDACKKV